jgi:CRISPR-associated protein Csb2
MSALALHVRLHDGRYHGEGDWPPSPARLFQALVAGIGLGGPVGDAERAALTWLEERHPPVIAAPLWWRPRRGVLFYMPNNDSDRIEGDPQRMSEIRTATKVFRPYIFNAAIPFVYAWQFGAAPDDEERARAICRLAERLYQLGRGVDMAWAWGEFLDDETLDGLLAEYPGQVFRPSIGSNAISLPSPLRGSLAGIERRYRAYGDRFHYMRDGKAMVFRQPPKPRFASVGYDSPPARQVYELRELNAEAAFAPWALARASALVVRLRDGALELLKRAMPGRASEVERVLVGRKLDGTNDGPLGDRVRIIPLPSIGRVHADREIRRVLVEVPATCPIRAADVHWAFSSFNLVDTETGEVHAVLTRADSQEFLRHYGIDHDRSHRVWRTVTPAALPEAARRRRIDPARQIDHAKAGRERAREQECAAAAVCQALRHAEVRTAAQVIRVQREPFDMNGARVEGFADGSRFAKERLWHVEVTFESTLSGPLVIGDGRFLGLGVMAPVVKARGVHVFTVGAGLAEQADAIGIARALRRAVMARTQAVLGDSTVLPAFFSGHEPDGAPAKSQLHPHVAFVFDPRGARLLVVAPHVLDRREATRDEVANLSVLEEALRDFHELRAGTAGLLKVRATIADRTTDPLLVASRTWESSTSYHVTRHAKKVGADEALAIDLRAECRRIGLPAPHVEWTECRGVPGVGLVGWARLAFEVAVEGPLLLGRCRHTGSGLFAAVTR